MELLKKEIYTLEELRLMTALDGNKELIFKFQVDKALSRMNKEKGDILIDIVYSILKPQNKHLGVCKCPACEISREIKKVLK